MFHDLLIQVPVVQKLHDDATINESLPKVLALHEDLLITHYVVILDGCEDPDLVEGILDFLVG